MPQLSRRDAISRLGLAAAAVTLPPLPKLVSKRADRAEEFERILRLASVPSMNVVRVDGDKITTDAYGVRQIGASERATPTTIYQAASLTKSVFSYAILGLVDEGVLSLDKPVVDYIALPNPSDARAPRITARHLMSHSSGWRNWRNNVTTPLTSDFEPGSRWSYSGEGFFHLQRIAEKLTGKSLGQLLHERVFDPLGMKHSAVAMTVALEADIAPGHDGRGGLAMVFGRPSLLELRRMMSARGASLEDAKIEDAEQAMKAAEPQLPVLPNFLSPNAAATMITTGGDFGLFLRHIVTAKKKGGQPARIVAQMMSPQVRCNEAVQWGLGVGLDDVGGARYAWQWGDNSGYKHIYFADPENERAIAVFTNGDRGARVYERVVRELTNIDHPAFLWL